MLGPPPPSPSSASDIPAANMDIAFEKQSSVIQQFVVDHSFLAHAIVECTSTSTDIDTTQLLVINDVQGTVSSLHMTKIDNAIYAAKTLIRDVGHTNTSMFTYLHVCGGMNGGREAGRQGSDAFTFV